MARPKKRTGYIPAVPVMQRTGWQIASDRESMTYYGASFRLSVHLYIDEPGKWFASGYGLGFERHRLGATSLEGAAREALVYASAVIAAHRKTLDAAETTLGRALRN